MNWIDCLWCADRVTDATGRYKDAEGNWYPNLHPECGAEIVPGSAQSAPIPA